MRKLILGSLIVFSTGAFSATEQIPKDRKIVSIQAYQNSILVHFTPSYTNSQGCTSGSKTTFQLPTSIEDGSGKNSYSLLLTAAAASKKVGFGIEDCAGQYPKIYRVDVDF